MNDWGKQNLELNPSIPDKIRWITDDVQKFISREIRRESKYNLIVLDPPSFGRGKQGQVWKLEDGIINLLEGCHQIIDNSKPFYLLLSCHTPGFSPIVLERLLKNVFGNSCFLESGEMTIPEQNGRVLPAGVFCRYSSR
jgi:23S rRNA (cytosine1962-C5)-methyltransferase